MDAFITLAVYLLPFLIIAVVAKRWMKRQATLCDVRAEGRPNRARFLLGLWRRDDQD